MFASVLSSKKRIPLAVPLLVVLASGLFGMLLARHFLQVPPVTAVVAQAEAPAEPDRIAMGTGEAAETPSPLQSGADPSVAARGAADAAAATPHAEMQSPGYVTEDREIDLVLRRWQTALLTNDAARIAPSYARDVDRYFLQTGVNRAFVRAYLRGQESRGWRLTAFTLHDVSIQHINAQEVDVRFVAGFAATTGTGGRAGSARTLLKLRPEDGDWKIFYERDFNS